MPTFLHRQDWGFPGPLGPPMPVRPVRTIFVHHSVTPVTADPRHDARQVANIGIERFGRCSYSYAIHPSGVVLEMQGDRVGAHTARHNSSSFGVVLLGNYDRTPVPGPMTASACWLVWALRQFHLVAAVPLVAPHRSVSSTACPGQFGLSQVVPWMQSVAADQNWRPTS